MDTKRGIIDTHIHIDQYADDELPRFIERMRAANCARVIAVGSDLGSSRRTLELAQTYEQIVPAAGFHPEQGLPSEAEVTALCEWIVINAHSLVAIGEIGLPTYLFRERPELDKRPYIALLERLLDLAAKLDKPVNLHAVHDEADLVCDLLDNARIGRAHFHWFKGKKETMRRMAASGFHISATPEVVYRKKIQSIVQYYPLDLLLLETDGPWPFDGPFAGERTHPWMIRESIKSISVIKQMSTDRISEQIFKNALYFYNLECFSY